jgi:hypothetical protein
LSTIHSLESRGHQVVMYQQADEWWHGMSQQDLARLTLLDEHKNIVDGFRWCAVREQHRAGVLHLPNEEHVEPELRHRLTGEHGWLNNYLETYIRKHELHL